MKICLSFKHLLVIFGLGLCSGILTMPAAHGAELCASLLVRTTNPALIEEALTGYTRLIRQLDLAQSTGEVSPMQQSLRLQQRLKKEELLKELQISESKFNELIRKKNKTFDKEEHIQQKKEQETRAATIELLPPTGLFKLANRIEKNFSRGHYLSADKKQLVVFDDNGLTHIDLISGAETAIPIAETYKTLLLPHQNSIFISTKDGSFLTYNIQSRKLKNYKMKVRPGGHPLNLYIDLSPDKNKILFQGDEGFLYVEAATGKRIASGKFPILGVHNFASNDHLVITSESAVTLYTISTDKYIHLADLDPKNFYHHHPAFSPKPLILENGDFLLSIGNDLVRYDLQGNIVLKKENRKYALPLAAIGDNLWIRDDSNTGSVAKIIRLSDLEVRRDLPPVNLGMLDDVIVTALSPDFVSLSTFRDFPRAKIFNKDELELPHFDLGEGYIQAKERFRSQIISPDGKQILFFGETAEFTPFIDIWVQK